MRIVRTRWLQLGAVCLLLATRIAMAEPGRAPGTGTGDGSSSFTGLAQAPEANLFIGAVTTSVRIELPPGRKNLTPEVALAYNSGGGPSPYGFGWDLPLGRMQRSRKHGVIHSDAFTPPEIIENYSNSMVLSLPGGAVECLLKANNVCEPLTDEGFLLIQADRNANTWTVRDRSGLRYVFGQAYSSRAPYAVGFDLTTTWALTQIVDLRGNVVEISYEIEEDVIYPIKITYGGWSGHDTAHPARDGVFEVLFTWLRGAEVPADVQLMNAMATASPATIRRMLSKVQVRNRLTGAGIREYRLTYDFEGTPRQGRRGFLTAVTLRGKGNALLMRGDGAPASTTFAYAEHRDDAPGSRFGFAVDRLVPPALSGIPNDYGRYTDKGNHQRTRREIMDMNGDGIADLVDTEACSGANPFWRVFLGSRNGFTSSFVSWRVPGTCFVREIVKRGSRYETDFDTFDITGDGIPDFVDGRGWSEGAPYWTVYRGKPLGWSPQVPGGFDIAAPAPIYAPHKVLRRTVTSGEDQFDNLDLLDLNGDGRLDLVYTGELSFSGGVVSTTSPGYWQVAFGTPAGTYFANSTPFASASPVLRKRDENDQWVGVFDVNGDGLADHVNAQWGGQNGIWRVALNHGRYMGSFEPWGNWSVCGRGGITTTSSRSTVRDLIDLNGDGLPDLVTSCSGESSWRVRLNRGANFSDQEYYWGRPFAEIRYIDDNGKTRNDTFDFDGDGLVDHVDFDSSLNKIAMYPNAGGAWVPTCVGSCTAFSEVAANPAGIRPDLQIAHENGIGGTMRLRYRPSNQWLHVDDLGVPQMPYSLWVVTRVESHDGLCSDLTNCARPPLIQAITYNHGRFEPRSREFRGFGTVETTDGLQALRTTTFHHQDHHRKGRIRATEKRSWGGSLLHASENQWECVVRGGSLAPGCDDYDGWTSRWVRLIRNDDFEYDATGGGRRQSWMANFEFDSYGNVTYAATGGDGSPRVDTRTEYAVLPGQQPWEVYLLDKPAHVVVRQNDAGVPNGGTVLEEKWFEYGSSPSQRPHEVRRVSSWLHDPANVVPGAPQGDPCPGTPAAGQGSCVFVSHEYDAWGNMTVVESTTAPRVTTEYDATTRIYPYLVTTEAIAGGAPVPFARRVATWYDVDCGVLSSQTTAFVANGGVIPSTQPRFAWGHDAFCREWIYGEPDPADPMYTTVLVTRGFYLGAPGHASSVGASHLVVAGASWSWRNRVDLFDALGRPLQSQGDAVVGGVAKTVASTTIEYDAAGRPQRQYVPAEVTPVRWPHPWGAYDVSPLPAGTGYTTTSYDERGRIVRSTQPDLSYSTVDYSVAWQTTSLDACYTSGSCPGSKIIERRDATGRVVEKQVYKGNAFETRTEYKYDGAGRLLWTRQGTSLLSWNDQTKVEMAYDSLGRKVRSVDPDSGTWRYAYDLAGNLIYQDDPKGASNGAAPQSTQFVYDGFGRLKRKRYVGNDGFCTVGAVGCPETDFVAYQYDESPSSLGCPETCSGPAPCNLGRLTSTIEGVMGNTTKVCHDVLGRPVLSAQQLTVDIEQITATVRTAYDVAGNVTSTTYPDGEVVTYGYDSVGQLQSVAGYDELQTPVVYAYDIKYDLFGRSTFLGHGNDVIDTVNYHGKEQNYRPQSRITTLPGAGPGLFLHYEDYQKNGLLKKVNDLVYGPGNPLRNAAQFAYDGLGRLTAVTNSEMNGSYEHSDKLGNLTRKDGTALRYHDASRPHRITRATGGLAPYGNIAHDGNGNQSAWGDRTYAYTGDDRLREVSGAGYAVRFHYDGSGARIAKSDLTAGVTWYIGDLMEVSPAYVTKYYFAGGRRIASQRYWRPPYFLAAARPWVQVASAVLAGGVPAVVVTVHEGGKWILGFVALGGIAILWIPGRRKAVVGIRLRRGPVLGVILAFTLASLPTPVVIRQAQAGGGGPADDTIGIRHYHYDHLGSVQLMTTANGGVYRQVRYNAYGMVRGTWGAAGQTASGCSVTGYCIGYTGYDQEPKSQILYARARFYDPGLGIFLTHDPARQFANPYTYVGWNPINATDPSGMWVDFAIAIGAAVVSALAASGIAVAIDAYVRTGDALGATKAGLVSHGMNGLAPGTSYGMQLIAPDTFGKPDPGNYAIGLIPVVGSAYGSVQSFRAGNYASGVVGAAATVYAAYGAYQTIKSMYQQYYGAGAGGISQENQLKLNARYYGDRYRIRGITYGGTRATNVLVSQVGNQVTFEADVSLRGQASPTQVAGIEGQWSGSFGNYEVTTRLQVVPSAGDFSIDVSASVTRAHVDCLSCSAVHMSPADSGWTAAHEFGHVMGLPDRYIDVPGIGSLPMPGWRGNIMGQQGGTVWQRDIDFLLGR